MSPRDSERTPLLDRESEDGGQEQKVEFSDDDNENPRKWPRFWKYAQTLQIFVLALICPGASSIISPAISTISAEFNVSERVMLLGQTGFVCMLGIGPLLLAPMSETFGRRVIFLTNLTIFTILQIPTALAPDAATFIAMRTLSGFFGSVGVANGGGSISDMFETRERAPVLGFYLVGPLLGPSLGPLMGGLIVGSMDWRWIFWVVMIISGTATSISYFFLYETQALTILQWRKAELEKENKDIKYTVEGVSDTSIPAKIAQNSTRAIRILTTQPIVLTMSSYQALVFASMYSLYASYTKIWSQPPYNFSTTQIGLAYLGPAIGFIVTSVFIIFYIDRLYGWLCKRYDNDGAPEFRLPLANLGAVLLPISLFWFGWSVENHLHWAIPLTATVLFGASQVSIFNCVQTYYIDSFEKNAASALAAGAFLRSMFGGIVPLFAGGMFSKLGYGWGMSVFGIISLLLMPAPTLFFKYGKTLREKFPFKG